MPVSSLVVQADENLLNEVREAIDAFEGARITSNEGKYLVIITETADKKEDKTLWEKIETTPGVISLNLIYHNFEDVEETE